MQQRILSGIQPTGHLHLGNYLGAIKNWVKLQNTLNTEDESLYCIVDLHAITVWQDPHELRKNIREVAAAILAAGIDPERNILFVQSNVPEHAQMAWVFNCVARLGWLNRMTQFKEKAGKHKENASIGLYAYPVLMAADILTYKATHVPVGEDQKQHLELTRDIANKFNHDYTCSFFPDVNPLMVEVGTRIMSLRDGTKKMSKSDVSDYSRINMTDSLDEMTAKIKKAKTDAFPFPETYELTKDRPEIRNLIHIYAGLTDEKIEAVCTRYAGQNLSAFKAALIEVVACHFAPLAKEMKRILADQAILDNILDQGAEKAHNIAYPILREAYNIVGLR